MMYVDPTSQYKFVAKTAVNVPPPEASSTSSNITNDAATVTTKDSTSPTTVQAPPNTATHFQAPEHAQKQAVLLQNAGNASGTVQSGQIPLAAGQLAQGVAGIPGQGLTYDGKRMRKTMQRRTVDYNSSVIRFLESRKWFKSSRNQHTLQPQEIYNVDIVPPCGYIKNPMNAVTTKFVRTSTNKLRCPIFCVVWTPEGRRLVTGASSGEFTLWNGLTFNFETILQAHDRAVRSMVWSNNDLWLLTGDHGGFVKYWQSNMNNVKMYEAHKEPVRGLSFSPSDNKFASCSDDGLVKVWDFYRCNEERELKGHGADVKCVDWHPTKGLIVSGSKDSQQPVKLWDPKTGNSITTLHCHKSTVMTAKWNKNGNWLVTGSRDHLLKLFDIRMMKELQTFRGHKKEATVVAWHPVHETLFASGGSDGSLMFWLTGVDEKAGTMDKAHEGIVWSLSWHPLGHILCSGSNDHTSKFWARNRPGDSMIDKYNLDIQGSQEDGDYASEEGTSQASVPALAAYDASQVIPGVGLPVTASNVVLPDSKDVDAHLYGETSKDKTANGKPSATTSSEFPYPPAFSRSNYENRFGIPGLDMPNTNVQVKQENDGYKVPNLREPPKLRLPSRFPIPPNQSYHPPSGIRPPLTNHPGNHPPFGPRHGFDFRGPSGPKIQDPNANFGPAGSFPPNQYARFPGPRGGMHEGPRGGFGAQRGPGQWSGPHHASRGGPFEPYGPQNGPRGGPNSQNKPSNNYGRRDGQHEGPRPHGDPSSPHVRPDGSYGVPRSHDIPISQYGPRDGPHGGTPPRGAPSSANMRPENSHGGPKPPLNIPGRHDGLQGEPHGLPVESIARTDHPHESQRLGRRGPNVRSEGQGGATRQHESAQDGLKEESRRDSTSGGPRSRDDSHNGSHEGQHETPHGGSRPTDFPHGQLGPRDGPRGGPKPPLNIPSTNFPTPGQHGPRDGTREGPRPRGFQNDPSIRPDGPRGDPRPPLNLPLGPSSPRDSPNFGPRAVNDTGRPFGPRGSRPPHFQKPRPGQPKAELKSPEGDHRGASEARESFLRRSRDSSPRDSPPVKQERRTSDPDAPGILGDFQTHIQELQRGMLENITSSAVGRLFRHSQPDMAGPDRPPHSRSDIDRHHGPDSGRGIGRKGDRDRSDSDRRGDRPPYESRDRQDTTHPGQRPSRDRSGDSDRPPFDRSEMGQKEDRSYDNRSDMGRPKDRPSFEGFSGDRPSRSGQQDRFDKGQPGGRSSFDSSGRQPDEKNLPANEKPGLLPIPDMFLARGPPSHDGPPHDSGSANHRPPDRRRDHGRFQDGRNDMRSDKQGFGRGPRDHNHPDKMQGGAKCGGGRNEGPQAAGETGIKPLMSLLDAPPVTLGSPPGHGNVENRGRKRSMEHEFDRASKRMGTGENRERLR